jgi:hypothetical protein
MTRIVQVLADPRGNRAQRRAAVKIARMRLEDVAKLPHAAEQPPEPRWTPHASRSNGR